MIYLHKYVYSYVMITVNKFIGYLVINKSSIEKIGDKFTSSVCRYHNYYFWIH